MSIDDGLWLLVVGLLPPFDLLLEELGSASVGSFDTPDSLIDMQPEDVNSCIENDQKAHEYANGAKPLTESFRATSTRLHQRWSAPPCKRQN
ncbi:hypothetical protein EVAR_63216_1 [Eumeta japonica]|uniref:Uncharacterized protein n=1 Tax=Eumeta variegata TaxID=151549 RepID=A0A4C1ZIE3_EUMVA|nr:hypothetical protein EVAR_63216_1 [Eumeta japonica]